MQARVRLKPLEFLVELGYLYPCTPYVLVFVIGIVCMVDWSLDIRNGDTKYSGGPEAAEGLRWNQVSASGAFVEA
jgi:hypothetical protein